MNSTENESSHVVKRGPLYLVKSLFNNSAFVSVLLFLVSFAVFIPSLSSDFVWDDLSFIKKRINRLQTAKFSIKSLIPPGRSRAERRAKRREKRTLRRSLKREQKRGINSSGKRKKERKNKVIKINRGKQGHINGKTKKYYRPVHRQSLILDAKLWGDSPFGFHLTNIILHSLSTILLYFLFLLVLKEFNVAPRYPVAFLSSMLFALYPLHVESVSFISARGDMLAAVFIFLTFILYILSYRRFIYVVPAAFSFYLSFLSKEVALTFPILIVGFDLISRRFKSRINLFKYLILGLVVISYLYLRSKNHMGFMQMLGNREYLSSGTTAQVWEVVTVFLNSYLFYLKKLVFPFDINPFIGTIPGGDLLYTTASILVITALIIIAVLSVRRKENVTGFSVLWIFVTLSPAVMISIFPLAITRFAERFLYIPSAGFCLLAGYVIIQAGKKLGRVKLAYLCGAILCLSFLLLTLRGQAVWNNELSLWKFAVSKSPREIVPKMNYASSLIAAERVDEAIAQYTEALGPDTYGNKETKALAAEKLGELYVNRGDFEKAGRSFRAAVSLNPGYEEKYNFNMGLISLKKNDPESAEKYLIKVTELNPRSSSAYYLLGSIYLIKGDMDENPEFYKIAEGYLETAAALKGAIPETHLKLAKTYAKLGKITQAKAQAEKAIKKGLQGEALKEARSIINQ